MAVMVVIWGLSWDIGRWIGCCWGEEGFVEDGQEYVGEDGKDSMVKE